MKGRRSMSCSVTWSFSPVVSRSFLARFARMVGA